jgi:uncharacterized membrane protein
VNRMLLIVTAALALALLAASAGTYSTLPPQIPIHFGPSGVDRWAPKTFFAWHGLPLLALGLCAMNYLIGALLAPRPHLINIPRKARLLALPRDRQQRVMRWFWVLMQTIGLVEVLLLTVAQYGLWRAAAASVLEEHLISRVVISMAVAMVPLTLWIVWQMSKEIERQERVRE